jgi:hypothetical protein
VKTKLAKGLEGETFLLFWCPGCDEAHGPIVARDNPSRPFWNWNGSRDFPTLSPSILSRSTYGTAAPHGSHPLGGDHVCHCYVRNGQIEFLGDSTHKLSCQVVPIPDWPYDDTE